MSGCYGLGGDDQIQTLKIGLLTALSGELRSNGPAVRDAAVLPLEQLADSSLSLTVDHRVEDTATREVPGVAAAETLVDAGYPAIVGPLASAVSVAVAEEVLVPNRVVGCSPSATSPLLSDLDDHGYMFRTAPSDALQGAVQATVATERLDSDTAAILYLDDAYGEALASRFEERFRSRGGEIVGRVPFEEGRTSYASDLQTALADDPDVLNLVALPSSGATILSEYYEAYGGHNILLPDGLKKHDVFRQVQGDLAKVVGTAPIAAGPNREAFETLYRATYDKTPSVFTANGYDAGAVLALASAAATNGDSLMESVESVANPGGTQIGPDSLIDGVDRALRGNPVEYHGASSPIEFKAQGDVRSATYELWGYDSAEGFSREDVIRFAG